MSNRKVEDLQFTIEEATIDKGDIQVFYFFYLFKYCFYYSNIVCVNTFWNGSHSLIFCSDTSRKRRKPVESSGNKIER